MPDLAFSPDATFPAIHAEKGILDLKFKVELDGAPKEGLKLEKLAGGNATNMVPDSAEAVLSGITRDELDELLAGVDYQKEDLTIKAENNNFKLLYQGISAHGSMPENGKNAISYLINILAELPFANHKLKKFLEFYQSKIGLEYDGQSIGCKDQDEIPTKLTFNTGIIKAEQKE